MQEHIVENIGEGTSTNKLAIHSIAGPAAGERERLRGFRVLLHQDSTPRNHRVDASGFHELHAPTDRQGTSDNEMLSSDVDVLHK